MAKLFPELKRPLHALLKRTWDLMVLLKNHFYHPDFQGSFSIKKVLPALAPHLRYEELDISDGKAAMHEYLRSLELASEDERKEIHRQLLVYCAMDTQALVEIRKFLNNWVKDQPTA
jgi:predicted RecB family nuclease